MQFNRTTLLKAVRSAAKVAPKRATFPILKSVLIDGQTVRATDLDTWLELNCRAVANEPYQPIITQAKRLVELLASMGDDFVTFERTGDALTVNGFSLDSFRLDDYPTAPAFTGADSLITNFSETLSATLFACSNYDYSRSILAGIHWKDCNVVATDGSRMSWVISRNNTTLDCIIPATALEIIQPLAAKTDIVRANQTDRHIQLVGDSWSAAIRLIDGVYPRYTELFPKAAGNRIAFSKKAFLAAVKPLKAGFERSDKQRSVRINPGEGTITAKDTVRVPMSVAGNVQAFSVNYDYVVQAVESMWCDHVIIEFHGKLKPLVFTDGDYCHLLMPVESKDDAKERVERARQAS